MVPDPSLTVLMTKGKPAPSTFLTRILTRIFQEFCGHLLLPIENVHHYSFRIPSMQWLQRNPKIGLIFVKKKRKNSEFIFNFD